MPAWRPRGLEASFFEEEDDRCGPEDLLLFEDDLEGPWRDEGRGLFRSRLSECSLFLFVPDKNKKVRMDVIIFLS